MQQALRSLDRGWHGNNRSAMGGWLLCVGIVMTRRDGSSGPNESTWVISRLQCVHYDPHRFLPPWMVSQSFDPSSRRIHIHVFAVSEKATKN